MTEKLISEDALLDLILTNREELIGDVKVRGCLGCSDCEMEFRFLRRSRAKTGTTTLDFKRADFKPIRDLLGTKPWDTTLERRRVQESW